MKTPSEFIIKYMKTPSEFIKDKFMYFKRKMDKQLDSWLKEKDKTPALIIGIRQCGKTETIREFAKRNGLKLIELNFWTHPEYCSDFESSLDVDVLISNLSLRFPEASFNPKETLIFFDEIQDCPRARLSFKSVKSDGRFNVIGSGSYLGINGYNYGDTTPTPIGYDDVFQMKTMDFEEFLWALGYKEEQISLLSVYFEKKEPIPQNVHELYENLFLKYISIGGFPKVVKKFVETKRIVEAFKELQNTIFDMKGDFGRRKGKDGKPIFKAQEVARIQNVFDLIPTFLAKENKRFIVSKISTGSQYEKKDAIEYLCQAHIVSKVFNLEVPSLPLAGQKIESQFKLFPEDIGIVTSMYGIETMASIYRGNMGQGKGAIYEAAVFDSLSKAGIEPYYFSKDTGLEVDFVIAYLGYPTLVETKTTSGNVKSSRTIMKHPEHYGKTKLIKIGEYNIGQEGDIITIPHYLVFLLGKTHYDF